MSMIAYNQERKERELYHYTTNNRGENWILHPTSMLMETYNFKTDFVDTNRGWILVDNQNLYRTESDTTVLELIATVKDITGLKNSSQKIGHFDFVNHHVGWIIIYVEGEQRLYKTLNGGSTWIRLNL
jgi:hypothetical protein